MEGGEQEEQEEEGMSVKKKKPRRKKKVCKHLRRERCKWGDYEIMLENGDIEEPEEWPDGFADEEHSGGRTYLCKDCGRHVGRPKRGKKR